MKQEQHVRYNLKLDWDVPFFFFLGGRQSSPGMDQTMPFITALFLFIIFCVIGEGWPKVLQTAGSMSCHLHYMMVNK